MKNKNQLPLRIGVGIALLNNQNKVFVGKRIDNANNFWQMPQGGVNENETFEIAAKRELEEETGIKNVKLIKEVDNWLVYNLPYNLLGKIWEGKYSGQKQKWFIMKFVGDEKEININTKNPEFLDWKWVNPLELPKIVVDFKISIYKKISQEIPVRIVDHHFHNHLAKAVQCRPNTGFMAIYDLLRFKPKILKIYGFSFYLDGFIKGVKEGIEEEQNKTQEDEYKQ